MASVSEQLQQLAALLEKGLITREQFENQRDQLLAESHARISYTPSDPTMSTEVGAYRLLGLIGEGGMGVVYRGRHRSETMAERQGGDVAVKVMHPQYAKNTQYRDRFEREASLGIKLDHPGIVKVRDLVVDGGNLALVMDLVDGRPLSDLVGVAMGPLPWDRAWPLFHLFLAAVGYAHDQEVVHRDIKPENILVTADGEPHVIDFGIAKDLDASGTNTGTGMGSVEYMAPEQYTNAKAVDKRADIYSLGMILYEMLAGRLPWDADAPQFEILEQKARKQLMSPSAYCVDIPPEIVAALAPALAAAPGARPSTTAAFAEALEDASVWASKRSNEEERKTREAAKQQAAVEGDSQRAAQERQRVEQERQRREAAQRAAGVARRQKVEQERHAEVGAEQIAPETTEPGAQRVASPVLRTTEASQGVDDRMPQNGRRLRLMGGVAAVLCVVVSALLTWQIVKGLRPDPTILPLPPAVEEETRSGADHASQDQPEEERLAREAAEEAVRTAEAETLPRAEASDEEGRLASEVAEEVVHRTETETRGVARELEERLARQVAEDETPHTETEARAEAREGEERIAREATEGVARGVKAVARTEPDLTHSNAEFAATSLAASRLRQWRLGLGLSESQAGDVLCAGPRLPREFVSV